MRPVVILVGATGSGRTLVGRALATQLNTTVVETEDVIEAQTGQTLAELALADEPERFREQVRSAATAALGSSGVVTLLPSAVGDPKVAELMAEAGATGSVLVALTADLTTLARRTGLNAPRSAALGQPRRWFGDHVRVLVEQYSALGAVEISTVDRDPAEVATEICQRFALQ